MNETDTECYKQYKVWHNNTPEFKTYSTHATNYTYEGWKAAWNLCNQQLTSVNDTNRHYRIKNFKLKV